MPLMESGIIRPIESFAVDVVLKQASEKQVPGLIVAPASYDSKIGITGAPNVRIESYEVPTPPATKNDPLGTDTLFKADSVIDTTPTDLKPPGTHTLSGADPLTEKINNHVAENAVSSSSAGFMDKFALPPTTSNGDIENIPASSATRLKRRLEDTKDLIVCPGVYDGFSARIALSVGCDAMYMVLEPRAQGFVKLTII